MNIIARSTINTNGKPSRVILYSRDHRFTPYVVHNILEEDGAKWEGTYTSSIAVAAAEFERRCKWNGIRDERIVREAVA